MENKTKRYNREITAKRLNELRKRNGETISFKKLSQEIKEKTDIYISAVQLNKYETIDKTDIMNVENLIAIADYYNISVDYVLGRSSKEDCMTTKELTEERDRFKNEIGRLRKAVDSINEILSTY